LKGGESVGTNYSVFKKRCIVFASLGNVVVIRRWTVIDGPRRSTMCGVGVVVPQSYSYQCLSTETNTTMMWLVALVVCSLYHI